MRRKNLLAVSFVIVCVLAARADEPKPDAKKPPYERLLEGDDAKQAAELNGQIEKAIEADQYDKAIELGQELRALRTKVQGTDHWETVNERWALDGRSTVAALPAAKRVGWRKALDGNVEAEELEAKGQYADAMPLWQEHHRWCLQVFGEKHPDTAESCNNLAANLNSQGKYDDALPFHQKAFDIYIDLLGEKHPDTADGYTGLAFNLRARGKHADAQPLFQKALDLRRELHGEKHPDTAMGYNNLAANLDDQGKYAEAHPFYQKAVALCLALHGEKQLDTAISYNNLAYNLNAQGKYADAQPLYQRALDLRRELLGEKHADTAMSYNNVAHNLRDQGKYAEAQILYEKALDLRCELLGEKHPHTAASYNVLALNLSSQGKYADAQPLYQKAFDLRLELLGEKHPATASSYNNLALNLNAQGKYADALPFYQKALALYLELFGEKHPDTARSYHNLAHHLTSRGNYADALPFHQKALDIYIELLGENHPLTANSYNMLAVNLSSQGKCADAQPLYQKAFDLRRELLGENHPETARSYNNLACNLHAQGKYDDAAALFARANSSYEAARLDVAGRGLDRAVFGLERSPYPLQAATEARLHSPAAAWAAAETDLARGLSDEIAARRRLGLAESDERRPVTLTTRLSQLQPRILEIISKQSPTDLEKLELAALRAERMVLEAQLAESAIRLSQREVAPLAEVQGAIPGNAALILWIDVEDNGGLVNEHWGCVVRRTGEPRWERLPGTGANGTWTHDDSALAEQLRDALAPSTNARTDVDALAQELYAQRLAPFAKQLEGVKNLYIAGVNEMAGIPVEVLTRDFTISYVPSGTFLASLSHRDPAGSSGLFALGDPVFTSQYAESNSKSATDLPPGGLLITTVASGGAAAKAQLRPGDWKDLPGTRVEITQLAKMYGDRTTTLVDSAASEQALDRLRRKGDLSRFRYLHLATHGEVNNVRAFESVLILAQDTLPKDSLPHAGEPFINGQLSANEVLEFWELNADLVTLSACESALGRKGGGDGLLGFAQAFLTAGSRAVCLSLWKVDDTATALLMTRFYQNLLGKRAGLTQPMPKARALAEAKEWLRELSVEEANELTAAATKDVVRPSRGKVDLLKPVVPAVDPKQLPGKVSKPFAHPRYWSAFILIGDPN